MEISQKEEWFPRLVFRYEKFWILFFFILTVFSLYEVRNLRIDNSVETLLQRKGKLYSAYKTFTQVFGNAEVVVVAFYDRYGIFRPEVLKEIHDLTNDIRKKVRHVQDVISVTHAFVIDSTPEGDLVVHPLLDLSRGIPTDPEFLRAVEERVKKEPLFQKTLLSDDGRTAGIVIRTPYKEGDQNYRKELTKDLLSLLKEYSAKYGREYHVGGPPVFLTYFDDYILRDLLLFTPLVVGIVLIILWLAFRSPVGILFPLMMVALGSLWTLGFMGFMHFPVTLATTILPPLLIVTGVEDAIYIYSFMQKHLAEGGDKKSSAYRTSLETWIPCFFTSITTAVGFGSLAITNINAVFETGVVSGVGTMLLWAGNNILLPILLQYIPVREREKEKVKEVVERGFFRRFLDRVAYIDWKYSRTVFTIGLLITGSFVPGIFFLKVETNFIKFFHESSPIVQAHNFMEKHLSGVAPLEVLVDTHKEGGVKDPKILSALYTIGETLKKEKEVDWVYSPADFLLTLHQFFHPTTEESSGFPITDSSLAQQYFFLYQIAGGGAGLEAFVSPDFRYGRVSSRLKDTSTRVLKHTLREANRKMEELEKETGAHFSFADNTAMLVSIVDALFSNTLNSLLLATVVIFLLIYLYLRKFVLSLLFMIPNLIPIFAVLGVMGYTGIELSITTMMIGSVAIGLAVNNTIHIFAHFPLSLSRTKDVQQSLYETVRNVGRPAISTGFALMMGFLILIFSEFYPNFYFGILSAFTLLVALICDLTITFVLWVFVGKRLLSAQ